MSVLDIKPVASYPGLNGEPEMFKVSEVSSKAIESDLSDDESSSGCGTNSGTSASASDLSVHKKDVANQPQEIVQPIEDIAVAYDGKKPPVPRSGAEISEDIVRVLSRYSLAQQTETNKPWGAKAKFLDQVGQFVAQQEAVSLTLPAFPFKSPNKHTKVPGTLPDKGEEVALCHLQGLCLAIKDVYEPGANVYIVSDGLMYNDILGVSDLEVWRYGQALRKMARGCKCDHVKFLRLRNLIAGSDNKEAITEEEYVKDAPLFRNEILTKFLPENFDPDVHVAKDQDATRTYRGYIKFLETDLAPLHAEKEVKTKAQIKKNCEEVAKKMIVRGKAFANSIAQNLETYIRLSIHPSSEKSKLSMSLIPQIGRFHTPWHAALVRAVDGSITMTHAREVPSLTHDLIYDNDGRPSYFRERSPLFDWPGMDVNFDYIYPTGIIITPRDPSSKYSLHNVHMQKVRGLSEACSPVVLRGFTETTNQHIFEAKAYDAGTVAPWTFGIRQAVKDAGNDDPKASTVTSTEAMPMHYDGFFFLKKELDPATGVEKLVSKVPRFQYFSAVKPSPPGDGMTLFASSQLFFQHLPAPYTLADFENLKWDCKHSSNWNNHMTDLPLVEPHPTNGKPCVRWHEPWYQWQTKFSSNEIRISNGEQHYKDLIREMLYDRRVCLYFNFEQGDVLVADNTSMMHTRTAFKAGTGRELWRIHFN